MEKQSLLDYENMQKFLQLLDENDMHDQRVNIEFLAKYIDQMEFQFESVLEELKGVKQELSTIQDKTLRATANRAIDRVLSRVDLAKAQVLQIKAHIKTTVDKAVDNFKEHGKVVLFKAVQVLNVKTSLQVIKNNLDNAIEFSDKGIDSLSKFADEAHAVSMHFKNIGRMLIGKNTKEISARNPNKGLILKVQESLFLCMNIFTEMSKRTDNVIKSVKSFEKNNEIKNSVKDDLKEIKKSIVNKQSNKSTKQLEQR